MFYQLNELTSQVLTPIIFTWQTAFVSVSIPESFYHLYYWENTFFLLFYIFFVPEGGGGRGRGGGVKGEGEEVESGRVTLSFLKLKSKSNLKAN